MPHLKNLITAARGGLPVDCLFTNARIINVFSGEILSGLLGYSEEKLARLREEKII